MISRIKQRGFLLLEVLLVIIVLMALTIWWVKQQNISNQHKVAARMKQQSVNILSGLVNLYDDEGPAATWPPKSIIAKFTKGVHLNGQQCLPISSFDKLDSYLSARDMVDPFGDTYSLCWYHIKYPFSGKTKQLLPGKPVVIQAPIYDANLTIAQQVASYFSHGMMIANQSKNKQTVPWYYQLFIQKPVGSKTDTYAVHTVEIKHPGDTITWPKNHPEYVCAAKNQQIFTSVSSCYAASGNTASGASNKPLPIEACEAYAEKKSAGSWKVHMRLLTPVGWVSDADNSINKDDTSKELIQVILKCRQG